MPYKDKSAQRKAVAANMRKGRLYAAAVAAANPKALEAERLRDVARHSMRPANELRDRIEALPREERTAFKEEYLRVLAQCQALDRVAAEAQYRQLRAEVIAEALRPKA